MKLIIFRKFLYLAFHTIYFLSYSCKNASFQEVNKSQSGDQEGLGGGDEEGGGEDPDPSANPLVTTNPVVSPLPSSSPSGSNSPVLGTIHGKVNSITFSTSSVESSLASYDIGLQAPFSNHYRSYLLGTPEGLPTGQLGGLTVHPTTNTSDPNFDSLLIPVSTNNDPKTESMYRVKLKRNATTGTVIGFVGNAVKIFDLPPASPTRNRGDGGNAFHPDGSLFVVGFPSGNLMQFSPSYALLRKTAIANATGGTLAFVPNWFEVAAGKVKYLSWHNQNGPTLPTHSLWYNVSLTKEVAGFNANFVASDIHLRHTDNAGPEGFAYVPKNSTYFSEPSIVVSEWLRGRVVAYEVDENADPIVSTRRVIAGGATKVEGAYFDRSSGDFLFSTWPNQDAHGQILILRGFNHIENRTGEVGVKVFLDLDTDGLHDVEEPVSVTDAMGAYNFSALTLGRSYRVTPLLQGRLANFSGGAAIEVQLTNASPVITGVDFEVTQ